MCIAHQGNALGVFGREVLHMVRILGAIKIMKGYLLKLEKNGPYLYKTIR